MNAEIIELGKRLAKNDMRSFSNFLASLISEEAKRRGLTHGPTVVEFDSSTPVSKVAEDPKEP